MAGETFDKIEYKRAGLVWTTYPEICKSCGLCIEKCPVKCLTYNLEANEYLGMPTVTCDIEKCIACHSCETACPDCAIRVDGKK